MKNNVGGSRALTCFLVAMLILFLAIPIALVVNASEFGGYTIVPGLIISFFSAIIVYLIISNEMGIKRMKKALAGKKGYGIVKESYMTTGRRSYYRLVIEFKNDNGDECISIMSPPSNLMSKFTVGKRVPIFINGNYCYYNLDDMGKINLDDNGYCPNCGQKLDGTEVFCKSCGTKL